MTSSMNRVAIVTGVRSGIDRATTLLFAKEGARVVVAARRRTLLDDLAAEIERGRRRAVALAGDMTRSDWDDTLAVNRPARSSPPSTSCRRC